MQLSSFIQQKPPPQKKHDSFLCVVAGCLIFLAEGGRIDTHIFLCLKSTGGSWRPQDPSNRRVADSWA